MSRLKSAIEDFLLAIAVVVMVISLVMLGIAVVRYFHPPLVARAHTQVKGKLSPVVRLTDANGRTFCSGVVVSPHTIITAGHCVLEAVIFGMPIYNTEIYIRDTNSDGPGVPAQVSSIRPQLDTATVTGDFDAFESRKVITDITKLVEIAQQDAVFIGCGYPLGGALYCSKLIYHGKINFMWLTKGELLPGMSGGPVMLDDGTVIAINDAVADDFAIISPVFNTPVIP